MEIISDNCFSRFVKEFENSPFRHAMSMNSSESSVKLSLLVYLQTSFAGLILHDGFPGLVTEQNQQDQNQTEPSNGLHLPRY